MAGGGTVCDLPHGGGFAPRLPSKLNDGIGPFVEQQEMEMEREFNFLSVAELEAVAGGRMDCKTAVLIAKLDELTGDILGALGNPIGQAGFYGQGIGLLQGACTK
jgi:hypothetical protein